MPDRSSMKVPLETSSTPDPVQRAAIALELIRNQQWGATERVISAIHETSDNRGKQIHSYLEATKEWIKDMKEIAGT